MTRKQGIVLVAALLLTIVTLAAIPFLQIRSDRADRVEQRKAGIAFVHNFDCTYGAALKELLASGSESTKRQAEELEKIAAAQKASGSDREAAASRKLARASRVRSADLLRQFNAIKPLAPGIPC